MMDISSQDDGTQEPVYERTLEDVTQMLKYAKLDKNNLTDMTQAIYFPQDTADLDNFMLIELNPDLLKEIEGGETLYIKGGLNEKAVLCSESKTYDIKVAEISNSLLLIPDLKMAQATSTSPLKVAHNGMNPAFNKSAEGEDDDEDTQDYAGSQAIPFKSMERKVVRKVFHEYFECTLVKPRYRKTLDLLQMTQYNGPENEYLIDTKLLFTYNQLLDTAQCSNGEFQEGLRRARAFDIEGHIRVLDYSYEYRCITYMLNLISENSWALNEIDEDETLGALRDIVPEEVTIGLFNLYTMPSDLPGKFKYNEGMISKILLLNILQPDLKFKLDEFMETWNEALPEGMEMDVSVAQFF